MQCSEGGNDQSGTVDSRVQGTLGLLENCRKEVLNDFMKYSYLSFKANESS